MPEKLAKKRHTSGPAKEPASGPAIELVSGPAIEPVSGPSKGSVSGPAIKPASGLTPAENQIPVDNTGMCINFQIYRSSDVKQHGQEEGIGGQ